MRELVTEAAQKLDYQPNRLARYLRIGLRKVIGVVIPDLQNPFLTSVVHGIEDVLCRERYSLCLRTRTVWRNASKHILQCFGAKKLRVWFSFRATAPKPITNLSRPGEFQWWLWIERLAAFRWTWCAATTRRRCVRRPGICCLTVTRKSASLTGRPKSASPRNVWPGTETALREASLTPRDCLVIHSDFRQEGGHAAMSRLLSLAKPPRAVLIANNLMALGALQAIHERGLQIPDEVAVLGFDDMPWATSLHPPLTAVAQPAEEIGRTAARRLLDRLKDPARMARQVILPATLVVRASCGVHSTAFSADPRRSAAAERAERPSESTVDEATLVDSGRLSE